MVSNAGTLINTTTYAAFGTTAAQTYSSQALRLGYAGQVFDPQTGLYYDNARYYDPAQGRFISIDPMGFQAGDTNLYRAVGFRDHLFEGGASMTFMGMTACTRGESL